MLETKRLSLERLSVDDSAFVLELLNEPPFVLNIGDKGVRTRADADRYILAGPVASYERFGFGLYRVTLKQIREPIGICGLLKRESLPDADLGFAFLKRFWSRGYAFESASAVLAQARDGLGLKRIVAITSPDNPASIGLLVKLGFSFERMARLSEGAAEIKLFALATSVRRAGDDDRPPRRS